MTMEDCPHNRDGLCQISTSLAGIPVRIAGDACAACQQQANPQSVNRVTCSKAIHARTLAGLVPTQELLDCVNPPQQGVGTELERLIDRARSFLARMRLHWIIPPSDKCGCSAARGRLNADGPAVCMANRQVHVAEIYGRWLKHWPQVRFVPFAQCLIAAFITRAVHNARRQEAVQ